MPASSAMSLREYSQLDLKKRFNAAPEGASGSLNSELAPIGRCRLAPRICRLTSNRERQFATKRAFVIAPGQANAHPVPAILLVLEARAV